MWTLVAVAVVASIVFALAAVGLHLWVDSRPLVDEDRSR